MDAFTRRLGVSQGRVDGTGLVLGDLSTGWEAAIHPGDFAEVAQAVDVTAVNVIRVRGRFQGRGPDAWVMTIRIDDHEVARLAGRTRQVTDLGADVSKLSGTHEVTVRLEAIP